MANTLPDDFEEKNYDLLFPRFSDSTQKAKRNLAFSSFIIISLFFLGNSVSDLSIFGLDLGKSNPERIYILGILLVFYWLVMFLATLHRDIELHKERKFLIEKYVEQLRIRKEHYERNHEKNPNSLHDKQKMEQLRSEYSIFEKQTERIAKAKKLNYMVHSTEVFLPFLLSFFALALLGLNLFSLISNQLAN
tara:strand:- start:194 stop:769 length:576 start_codon:yes stop_codon:yes gene_type:complete